VEDKFSEVRVLNRKQAPSELMMLIEFAPLIFATAGLVEFFLFFSLEEH